MSAVPSSSFTVPDRHISTVVSPGEWAQIIIGACGLVVTIAGLAIKYRKGIKKWIVGCWNITFEKADMEVTMDDEIELESQGDEQLSIPESGSGEAVTTVPPRESGEIDGNDAQVQEGVMHSDCV
ncbi:hypothetical protein K440DRAFT_642513 [Wilcoxina mikolae CBS 423.85]|nr:hypothetical protein K440DRAFT_642513 [Wilcoxina mikolae CBS 423.85]